MAHICFRPGCSKEKADGRWTYCSWACEVAAPALKTKDYSPLHSVRDVVKILVGESFGDGDELAGIVGSLWDKWRQAEHAAGSRKERAEITMHPKTAGAAR